MAREDRLGRRLGPEFDDYCFQWMIERAADSDPTYDWISMDDRLEWAGEQNSMSTGFRWRIDWAADSGPNSMTTVFRLGWMIEWAADADPNSMTTGSWTRAGPAAENRIP